jgi:UDP-N-acetylmuramoylalanine--D-glutamate ligase
VVPARPPPLTAAALAGARVVVWGFGRHGGGAAAARFCAAHGARVSILDAKPAEAFAEAGAAALAAGWEWLVGDASHPGFAAADLVVASPAIPPRAWPERHPPRTAPEGLFFAAHRGPRIAVTGTKGKSTTVRILSTLLGWQAGGNSYDPLLDVLERHGPQAPVVCELSSFQLWYLAEAPPRVDAAVLTSLAVDHLDWHPDPGHYRAAKLALLGWGAGVVRHPGGEGPAATVPLPGYRDGVWRWQGGMLARRDDLPLPGEHNAANATLALGAALAAGLPPAAAAARLRAVVGLPHRLCCVHQAHGLRFIDDSIATTPDSAIAALRSFDGPLAVILGGSDKGASFDALARAVAERGARPVLLGATAPRIAASLDRAAVAWTRAATLEDAVAAAAGALPAGGTVLLSPACASFDLFQGFEHRGRCFAAAAAAWRPPG